MRVTRTLALAVLLVSVATTEGPLPPRRSKTRVAGIRSKDNVHPVVAGRRCRLAWFHTLESIREHLVTPFRVALATPSGNRLAIEGKTRACTESHVFVCFLW
jgi:hypothetical protein